MVSLYIRTDMPMLSSKCIYQEEDVSETWETWECVLAEMKWEWAQGLVMVRDGDDVVGLPADNIAIIIMDWAAPLEFEPKTRVYIDLDGKGETFMGYTHGDQFMSYADASMDWANGYVIYFTQTLTGIVMMPSRRVQSIRFGRETESN